MQQHPVPQPITSYEFRLIGDMTLKQFGKLAAGVILALIVYGINPPALIKWFLILLFTSLGATAAFVPFEGRPIDVWIIAFFKRIYSPTQYTWSPRKINSELFSTQKEKISPTITPSTKSTNSSPQSATPPQPISSPFSKPVAETIFQAPPITIPKPSSPPPPTVTPKFSNIAIPATPSLPNLLCGFIHDPQGKIIEGAILEIRDASGTPVRAFKTNQLGQFRSATPLPNGVYEIETEKEGYSFDIIKVELKGEIVPPIEIISK